MLSNDAKIAYGVRLKEEGNALVKERQFKSACKKYRRVAGCIDWLLKEADPEMDKFKRADEEKVTADHKNQAKELRVQVDSNLALCYLSMGEYEKALEFAEKAISLDKDNIKALHRAGKACIALSKWQRAKEVLTHALSLEPESETIKNELKNWKVKYATWSQEQAQKEQKAFGGKLL